MARGAARGEIVDLAANPHPAIRAGHDRSEEHHPSHRAVGHRADRLGIFLRYAAKAAPGGAAAANPDDANPAGKPQTAPGSRNRSGSEPRPLPAVPQSVPQVPLPGPACSATAVEPRTARWPSPPPSAFRSSRRGSAVRSSLRPAGASTMCRSPSTRETIDPASPAIVLLSPSGQPERVLRRVRLDRLQPVPTAKTPGPDTVWRQEGSGSLAPGRPVGLVYDNGEGLTFRRTIAIDDKYLITLVEGRGDEQRQFGPGGALSLCALIKRHGLPQNPPAITSCMKA